MKTALICGVTGQDGPYLARFLLGKGYRVVGTSRDAQLSQFGNLHCLGIRDSVSTISMSLSDFRSVLQVLTKVCPDEVYNLAGQSSVGLSFEQPVETMESIVIASINLLEAIRFIGRPLKLYNACSSEAFGNVGDMPADEATPFRPRSPYGVARAASFWQVANYREAYGLFACSGILFNHESPLRPERFVTKKIVSAVGRIAMGSREKVALGDLSVRRDWGWAPEFVEAMWKILQQERPDDYVVATGQTNSLQDFVEAAFAEAGLNWREHVIADESLRRVADISVGRANPGKADHILDWRARYKMREVVQMMINSEIRLQKGVRLPSDIG